MKRTMTETCSAVLRSRRNCSSDGAERTDDVCCVCVCVCRERQKARLALREKDKKVLLLGAGYVSAPVVDYLTRDEHISVTVGQPHNLDTIRYDTIRDAILTCARKPT